MFHGREKKEPKNKKQKLSDLRNREDKKEVKHYEQKEFNRPKSTNGEISVIHPVKEKD